LPDIDGQERQDQRHREDGREGAEEADGEIALPIVVIVGSHQDFFGVEGRIGIREIAWNANLVYHYGLHDEPAQPLSIEVVRPGHDADAGGGGPTP
jgi:hypothetical protein